MAFKSEMTKLAFSTHFVLVHGASHGGWCWYKIRCLLESSGYKVSCPDLAGSGIDPANADTLSSFEDYNKPLHDILTSLPAGEKVILVGHSAGGLNVTDAMHNFPEKIQVAVFVAARMYRDEPAEDDAARTDWSNICDFGYGHGLDHPPTSSIIKKELRRELLYQMSPLEDCTLADMLLRPCPIGAQIGVPHPNDKEIDKVPRVYIKTMHDNMALSEHQESMIKRWPPSELYTIDSDHCAMFSNPTRLFGLLVEIATKFRDH